MNIAAILHESAVARAGQPAIVHGRRTIAFDDLDRAASAAATDLAALGIAPGMRVFLLVPMSIELYVLLIALFRRRATAVIVDPSAGMGRLGTCVARVAPDALVAAPKGHLLRLASGAVRRIPKHIAIGGFVPSAARLRVRTGSVAAPVDDCPDDTPALITFTSGSTGEPKAVVRTHGFLLAQHRALVSSLALAAGEVDLTTLPVFLLANLASGVTSVVPDADLRAPGSIQPGPVLAQLQAARVTRTVASPAFLMRLTSADAARRAMKGLHYVFTGGAPVFPHMLDVLADHAPDAHVVAVYGSTEAEPIAEIERRQISAADRAAMRAGAGLVAGPPVPAITLAVIDDRWSTPLGPWTDDDLHAASMPNGKAGEIIVAGDHVLGGYLDGRGDSETKIRIGGRVWHRTGDAGYLDAAGRVWLLGRCSAKVDDEHGRLYPFAAECAVSDVDGLNRSAFVRRRGARVLAIELAPGASRNDVVKEVRQRLEWARLSDVLVLPRLPVDARHNAKVDYPALQRMVE